MQELSLQARLADLFFGTLDCVINLGSRCMLLHAVPLTPPRSQSIESHRFKKKGKML